MMEAGHEVAITANFGLSGASLNWNGIPIYGMRQQRQCADVVGSYCNHFGADVCITLYDVWSLPPDFRQRIPVPWIAMTPVDGAPLNKQTVRLLRDAEYVVAYSQFAFNLLEAAGFDVDYVPHGVDTKVFSPGDKVEARRELGFPEDRFIISTVAANKGFPPRKAWPEMLQAYRRFRANHPKSLYYLHTTKTPYGSGAEGIYFDVLRDELGLGGGALAFPDQGALAVGVPDDQIALIYRASDVMMLPSMGEGFGLPTVEAQACGCPVITQACSAMTELTRNGLALEPLQAMWIPQLEYWWQVPSVPMIAAALEVIADRKEASVLPQDGIDFVRQNYDHDVVWEQYWKPFLARVESSLW